MLPARLYLSTIVPRHEQCKSTRLITLNDLVSSDEHRPENRTTFLSAFFLVSYTLLKLRSESEELITYFFHVLDTQFIYKLLVSCLQV